MHYRPNKVLERHHKRFKGKRGVEKGQWVSYSVTAYGYRLKGEQKEILSHQTAYGEIGVKPGEESLIYGNIISRHLNLSSALLTEYTFHLQGGGWL